MIYFRCPTCKHTLRSQDELAGTRLACEKCQQRLLIPPRRNKTMLGEIIDRDEEEKKQETATDWRKMAMSKLTKFRVRIGILLCVLAIISGYYVVSSRRSSQFIKVDQKRELSSSLVATSWKGFSNTGRSHSEIQINFNSNGLCGIIFWAGSRSGEWSVEDDGSIIMLFNKKYSETEAEFSFKAKIDGQIMTGKSLKERGYHYETFDVTKR